MGPSQTCMRAIVLRTPKTQMFLLNLPLPLNTEYYKVHLWDDHSKHSDSGNHDKRESAVIFFSLADVETNSDKHTLWNCHGLLVMTAHQICAWIFCLWWKIRKKKKGGDIYQEVEYLVWEGEEKVEPAWLWGMKSKRGWERSRNFAENTFCSKTCQLSWSLMASITTKLGKEKYWKNPVSYLANWND